MPSSNKLFWIFLSLITFSTFALIAPFAIVGESHGLLPPYAVLYRYFLLVSLATPFILLYARQHFNFTRQQFWLIILQSCSTAILNLSYMASLSFIPLSLTVIIFYTSPIITLMVAPLVFGGRLNPIKMVIFFIAFIGLIMVVGPQFSNLNPIGISLALIAAVTSVIQLLCMSKLVKETNPVTLIYSVHFIAMFITFGIMLTLIGTGNIAPPVAFNSGMAFNFIGVVICYAAGYGLFTLVSKKLEPTTINFTANIEPIITIALAILLFNESLSNIQIIGVSIVIGALIAGSLLKERKV